MKRIISLLAIITSFSSYTIAQELVEPKLSLILNHYYNIKNALVVGDSEAASSNALLFLKSINTVDYKVISEGNIHILAKDAGRIAENKELKKQRIYFANLSVNMIAVAKAVKF